MVFRLICMRHFSTPCHERGVYCGVKCNTGLSFAGERAAMAAREVMASIHCVGYYTSVLPRAVDSGALVVPQAPWRVLPGMEELDYGLWEGRGAEEIRQENAVTFAAYHRESAELAPPGGESGREVWLRGVRALSTLHANHPAGGNVMLVSHKSTLRIMLCGLLGIDLNGFRQVCACAPGDVMIWEWPRASLNTQARCIYLGPGLGIPRDRLDFAKAFD